MSQKPSLPAPHNLVPELQLVEPLPPHWRKRFEKAIGFMMANLDEVPPPSWDEVAAHCAISPHHFHRIFHSVFHQTPGQYLSRMRLQTAVHLLLASAKRSVTEIAHATGYSSSQALAKALKRELGTSARAIRALGKDSELHELGQLLEQLGHPKPEAGSLESQLVAGVECELLSQPRRTLKGRRLTAPSLEQLCDLGASVGAQPLLMVSDVTAQLTANLFDYKMDVGVRVDEASTQGGSGVIRTLPAGDYLCCRVALASETAYFAVWDKLLHEVVRQGLDLPEEGMAVEIVENPAEMTRDVWVMTLQLQVDRVE
ncbi:helix-turn-helix domain-containing protein [Ferrimonas futtsuensis]|uniref:helix-turn-helix domain-containing protein n=1 Tax=Ferrimonas futtsuensis TaxID=364764 RepID=UPI00041A4849|nr:helix-turn-helix domain-containing protein [Ferrimonas futtsuensis]